MRVAALGLPIVFSEDDRDVVAGLVLELDALHVEPEVADLERGVISPEVVVGLAADERLRADHAGKPNRHVLGPIAAVVTTTDARDARDAKRSQHDF